jgi:hypothetical protein
MRRSGRQLGNQYDPAAVLGVLAFQAAHAHPLAPGQLGDQLHIKAGPRRQYELLTRHRPALQQVRTDAGNQGADHQVEGTDTCDDGSG